MPALTGPVVDTAGILDRPTQIAIASALQALQEQGGSQITVLTVPSLGELSIEQASIQVVDAWRLGGRKTDNGVLLMIAPNERKMRIEVGRGLEGVLTDADSRRIIAESIRPLFQTGDYNSGTLVGVYQITRKTDPEIDLTPYFEGKLRRLPTESSEGLSPLGVFLILFILFLLLSRNQGRRRLHRGTWGGPWGGPPMGGGWGGGSWGGGSGGGWSGGGGGFAGGGASGDW